MCDRPTHPFERIKSRFYLQNTPESVPEEWKRVAGSAAGEMALNTVLLDLTAARRLDPPHTHTHTHTHHPHPRALPPLLHA